MRFRIIVVAGMAAALSAAPAGDAVAAQRVTYRAAVHVTGQLVVSFHGDPAAGCAEFFRCDVEASTLRWTPPSRGQLYLSGIRGRRLEGYVTFSGPRPGLRTLAIVQRGAADGTHICADGRGETFSAYSAVIVSRRLLARGLRFGLESGPRVFGPLTQSQLGTSCGGPLPADFLRDLPTRRVSLRALRRRPTTIDLAVSAPFAAAGLAGRVQSTIALRVDRARVRTRRARPRAQRTPRRPPFRNIAVEYHIVRVSGSMPVHVTADPRLCEPLDACGLSGSLTVTPGPARGEAYLYAYGRVSRAALRRAIGLAPGPPPRRTSVLGYASWTRARGKVTALLDRDGTPACRDSAPLSTGALDLRVRGRRITVRLGGSGALTGELLQTRCPGPLLPEFGGPRLAVGELPRRALRKKRLTLRLDEGARRSTLGYRLRSRPDLTVVLEREGVERSQETGFVVLTPR